MAGLDALSCRPASISRSSSSSPLAVSALAYSTRASTARRAIQLPPCVRSSWSSAMRSSSRGATGSTLSLVRSAPANGKERSRADAGRGGRSRPQRGRSGLRGAGHDRRVARAGDGDAARHGPPLRADLRGRRLDRRDLGRDRAPERPGREPSGGALQAEFRPAPGHARRARAGAGRDRGDDGRRPPERAGGHSRGWSRP